MTRQCISPGEDRPHSVYRYTDQIYKIVQFYSVYPHLGPGPKETQKHHDKKLDSSISRAKRVVLEKALCNHWDWFCTFTISKDKFDREDLVKWRETFIQWLRDQRKKGLPIQYLIVPEQHKDGSWHAHGLFSGLTESDLISFKEMDKAGYRSSDGKRLPPKLRNSVYFNWSAYQEKFGFCSFGKIRNPVACGFYITKYITKDTDRMVKDVGLKSYYCSQGLQSAFKLVDFYGRDVWIDSLLVNKYDFCATGMTSLADNCDWTTFLTYEDDALMQSLVFETFSQEEKTAPEAEADDYFDFEQLTIKYGM